MKIDLKPKTRDQVAKEYGISCKTLYNWIDKLDLPTETGLLTPRCLKIIYAIGIPSGQGIWYSTTEKLIVAFLSWVKLGKVG